MIDSNGHGSNDPTLKHLSTTKDIDGNETFDVTAICPPCGANAPISKGVSGSQANRTAGKMIGEWAGKGPDMHGGHGTPGDPATLPHIAIQPTSGAPSKKIFTPADAGVLAAPSKA